MSILDGCTCGATATMLPACPIHPQPATVQVRPPDTPAPSPIRHASSTSERHSTPLCGRAAGRMTAPKESVNCPECRVILNHVRSNYPAHAVYTDWRLTPAQARKAVDRMVADMHGRARASRGPRSEAQMTDTPAPSLGESLAAIRSRCEAASPPPWQWNVNRVGQEVSLYSEPGGRNIVMDFVRLGMGRAQPRFRVDGVMETAVDLATEVAGQEHNAAHLKDLTHPDAAFIAHAPEDIRFLLAAIARMETENAALRERVEKLAPPPHCHWVAVSTALVDQLADASSPVTMQVVNRDDRTMELLLTVHHCAAPKGGDRE